MYLKTHGQWFWFALYRARDAGEAFVSSDGNPIYWRAIDMRTWCATVALVLGIALAISSPALAGKGNPVYTVEGAATQTDAAAGSIVLSWKSKNTKGMDIAKKIDFTVGKAGTATSKPSAVARQIADALNANKAVSKDWTFAAVQAVGDPNKWFVQGTPKRPDVKDCDPGVQNGRDKTGARVTSYQTMVVAGTNDPPVTSVGTAYFDVFAPVTGPATGQIAIGIADEITPPLMTNGMTVHNVRKALVLDLRKLGLTATSLSSSGLIVVPDVELGAPLTGSDIGPLFDNIDSNLGGFAGCQICGIPEPTSAAILLPGLIGLGVIFRRRRLSPESLPRHAD